MTAYMGVAQSPIVRTEHPASSTPRGITVALYDAASGSRIETAAFSVPLPDLRLGAHRVAFTALGAGGLDRMPGVIRFTIRQPSAPTQH